MREGVTSREKKVQGYHQDKTEQSKATQHNTTRYKSRQEMARKDTTTNKRPGSRKRTHFLFKMIKDQEKTPRKERRRLETVHEKLTSTTTNTLSLSRRGHDKDTQPEENDF
jgi:hypothetical protein